MELEILTRHFNLADESREKIEAGFEKLERFSPRPVKEARLTLTFESGSFGADAALFLKNNDFRASGEGPEPELAAGEAIESLRKQLAKFKGKISSRQKGEEGGLGRAQVGDGAPVLVLEDTGLTPDTGPSLNLRDLDVESAMDEFAHSDLPFLVFRDRATSRVGVVYRRRSGELGVLESRES
ncbi:MAG: HPF/RaiA family ribosome-associated protein [Candidatus Krumholzibacteriia bacterium]